ncbi:hypothetical protein [Ruficoccus sp. ZRK36]|uniref:hypothetical protein n=1 Tax=Ruficoccus sp. ZRK36 TaxID=2866311 RepID=UPI001C732BF2|nr:hypothetical protein [Ruficoccus sp. ZRK36]QYY36113.1 hypothetical protein K0V07_01270 [Ruficoccus sp. ZRK36]
MNTPLRLLCFVSLAAAAVLPAGCSKKQPAPVEVAPPAPPAPKVVPYTSGRLVLEDMPDVDLSTVEIIVLDKLTPELIMLLSQQHKLYSEMLAPPEPEADEEPAAAPGETESDGLDLMSDRDRERLEKMLTRLQEEVPPRMTSSFTVNSDLRDFESRESLYERYAKPIAALTLGNMITGLNQIGENMRSDYELLVRETESSNEQRVLQAKADINWLASFSEYMQDYQRLVRRYDSLRRRAILRANRSASSGSSSAGGSGQLTAEQEFDRFQMDNSMNLQVVCYKGALGTTFADADGNFEVKGHGILLARIDDKEMRPVFFRDPMKAPAITFEDLQQTEKTE